jgi:galactose mutarotase-like enzyme
LEKKDNTSATYLKKYTAGTLVSNSKYPDKSTAQRLIWPYSFEFNKTFSLTPTSLQIGFTVNGQRDMPFMIGYHPAFKLRTLDARIKTASASYGLKEIMDAGNRAIEVPQTEELILKDQHNIRIKSKGFGHFMLWAPSENMICVEPISYYPYTENQESLHEGFMYLGETKAIFQIEIGLIS